MFPDSVDWILMSVRRRDVLLAFGQPLTVRQVSLRTGRTLKSCGQVLSAMKSHGLAKVLNPEAARSRVYWLTRDGVRCQDELRKRQDKPPLRHFYPRGVDWSLYGWVCFSHREAVVKALEGALQPAAIKRRARFQDPGLRMSANNVRDVIQAMLSKGVVRRVDVRGKAHPRYELTATGECLRDLLFRAKKSAGEVL